MKPSTANLSPLTRLDAILACLLGAGSLGLYVRTLAPGLLYGDSGEFQTVAYSLGMTHPTGYPIYVLMGRLFTLLPIGDLAWRVNLFSAALGALTVACVYLIVRMFSGWRLAAVAAALTLAVTPLFWYFSVIAELYVPACAFLSGVFLFLLLWRQTGKWPWLTASALLGGLSLGVHSSVALVAPAVLVYLLISVPPFSPRRSPETPAPDKAKMGGTRGVWLAAISGALLGVMLTLGAFLALDTINADAGYYNATVVPSLSVWGMTAADFDSPFERLGFLYAARQFKYAMFGNPAQTMPDIFGIYWRVLSMVFAPLSLALMGIGVLGLFFRRWREGLLLLLGWGVQMVFITNYAIFDVVVFFLPTFVLLALWLGIGLGTLMQALAWGMKRLRGEKWAAPAAALLGIVILGWSLHFWGGMVAETWQARAVVFMRGTEFEEYPYPIEDLQAVHTEAQSLVGALEDNAIVFLDWDLLFPCYFVAHIKESRTEMDFHETYPQEGVTEVGESVAAYIEANLRTRSVYFLERPHGTALWRFKIAAVHKNGIVLYQVIGTRP